MRNIYKITITLKGVKPSEYHFDKQDHAEKFVQTMKNLVTDEGKKELNFDATIINVFEKGEEIAEETLEAFIIAGELLKKK